MRFSMVMTAVLAGACVFLSACGLGDKQARAERIIDSVDAAYAKGAVSGTLAVAFEVVGVPEAAGSAGAPAAPDADAADDDADGPVGDPTVPAEGAPAADERELLGAYKHLEGGRRFERGEIPTTPLPWFKEGINRAPEER